MKVKVSYTIDLEEIPNKIRDIAKKNEETLLEISKLSETIAVGDLGAKSLQDLTRMKELSEDLRERYSDCEAILTGFLQAMFSTNEESTEEQDDDDNP